MDSNPNQQILHPRLITPSIVHALTWSPTVLLTGARQCGKTTLCKLMQSRELLPHSYQYLTFDDDAIREFARSDPVGFVDQLPQFVILDEIQLVPGIFRNIKYSVDHQRTPGQFLFTGSAQVTSLKELAESLVGRVNIRELYPLAQCEVQHTIEQGRSDSINLSNSPNSSGQNIKASFILSVLNNTLSNNSTQQSRLGKELAHLVSVGGYPVSRILSFQDRCQWFRDYVRTISNRDLKNISSIQKLNVLPKLIGILCSQTGGLLNISNLARMISLHRLTLDEYIQLLENLYLVTRLPAWSNNRLSRATKQAKLYISDTGLACAFLNIDQNSLWKDRKLFGHMVETFVLQELIKQTSWLQELLSFYHYRDRDRHEIDFVIEVAGKGVIAIEVKTRATVKSSDFRSIRKLREHTTNFLAGIVLYDGIWTRRIEQNLYAIPISRIFETEVVDSR